MLKRSSKMPRARNTDPKTSHEAADSVKNLTQTQAFILQVLNRPRTDPQLVEAYRKLKRAPLASESGIRSRRAELVDQGLVIHNGEFDVSPFGRRMMIWLSA
jgi:hypothetical protein